MNKLLYLVGDYNQIMGVNPKNGQLVTYSIDNFSYLHGGGKPEDLKVGEDKKDWQNSIISMFPIVGKPKNNLVTMLGREIRLNQHGLSRCLPWKVLEHGGEKIIVGQEYDGKSFVENLKFDPNREEDNENNRYQLYPFAFNIEKQFELLKLGIEVSTKVTNNSSEVMPYRLGEHPAFPVFGKFEDGAFYDDNNRVFSFEDVLREKTLFLRCASSVSYVNEGTGFGIEVVSEDYDGNWMIWTPRRDAKMFCIEPVTQIPHGDNNDLDWDCDTLEPGESYKYKFQMFPIKR